ncbi:MAG TPA: DUF2911 domain-containing protein [Gemmatimonadaceae bacterium]
MNTSLFLLTTLAALVSALPQAERGGPVDDRGSFVTTLGRDTVVVESFTRTASRVDGDIVVRTPGTVLIHYAVDLTASGAPSRSVVDVTPLGTAEVLARHVAIDFTRDTVSIDIDSGEGGNHRRSRAELAAQGPLQLMTGFGPSYGLYASPALYELYAPLARAAVGDTLHTTTIDIVSGRATKHTFIKRSPTSFDADFFGIAWTHFTLDNAWRVLSADASETTERTQTHRTDFIDAAIAAKRFAADDHAGTGLGIASPAVIARGTIGGQLIVATYSSPRKRNRVILGKVVPYDQIWRTGANEATILFFDKDLMIGDKRIAAGTYSIWTLPKRDGSVDLIINAQHGQWGTDYDRARDVAHIPMKVTASVSPEEDFAIAIKGGDPGELRISWDTFVWTVPVTVAK